MKKIYITGVSGTGKTTLANYFHDKGFFTIDIDSAEDLCHWQNKKTGERVGLGVGTEWLNAHDWVCNEEKLKSLVNNSNSELVMVFGMPANQNKFLDFFDKIFVLHCSEETFIHRINTRIDNPFGQEESEREFILSFYKGFENDLVSKGATLINSEDEISIVAEKISKEIDNISTLQK